jgi:hypothetical protein
MRIVKHKSVQFSPSTEWQAIERVGESFACKAQGISRSDITSVGFFPISYTIWHLIGDKGKKAWGIPSLFSFYLPYFPCINTSQHLLSLCNNSRQVYFYLCPNYPIHIIRIEESIKRKDLHPALYTLVKGDEELSMLGMISVNRRTDAAMLARQAAQLFYNALHSTMPLSLFLLPPIFVQPSSMYNILLSSILKCKEWTNSLKLLFINYTGPNGLIYLYYCTIYDMIIKGWVILAVECLEVGKDGALVDTRLPKLVLAVELARQFRIAALKPTINTLIPRSC